VDPVEELRAVAAEVRACEKCKLSQTRNKAVPGEGPSNSRIMFIGEGPGANEDLQGRPFVGAAGKFLEELLGKANLKRPNVFICNVVKCRPPGNRDPEPDEIQPCGEYLDRQIAAINPKVIVTLGRFSMAKYFPNAKISQIHGHASKIGDRIVVAMYHPAAALHQPALRTDLEKDFASLDRLLHPDRSTVESEPAPAAAEPIHPAASVQPAAPPTPVMAAPAEPEKQEEDPQQLSLF
jgi:uracil-DNA glycosylase